MVYQVKLLLSVAGRSDDWILVNFVGRSVNKYFVRIRCKLFIVIGVCSA
jgi:hypothetical protein